MSRGEGAEAGPPQSGLETEGRQAQPVALGVARGAHAVGDQQESVRPLLARRPAKDAVQVRGAQGASGEDALELVRAEAAGRPVVHPVDDLVEARYLEAETIAVGPAQGDHERAQLLHLALESYRP